jgi:nicotinate phosphoribosyltransferase
MTDSAAAKATSSALFTDLYSLTMAQGYWKCGMNHRSVFEMFYRKQPFDGGYSVFAGLETLLYKLKNFSFSQDDVDYLGAIGIFDKGFLEYLKDFRFKGTLWAMDEGTIVFPHEPLIRVDGGLIECQLIEGLLLNTVNFQSLIATKASRVWLASGEGSIMEFGLRRAQGPDGAMAASRAAFIGGAFGTSNVLAAKEYGIPALGTRAHSWIMSFSSEEEAFQAYADLYPKNPVFLIDTYDTLKSGIKNAIIVGKRLAEKGINFGVRLDSGDIHYLSVKVRKALDDAGLPNAKISVSNDLDESIIETLYGAGAPIDSWGVGTQLVTGGKDSSFPGVYKLAAKIGESGTFKPAMKFSDNPEKTTNPGIKQVWRIKDPQGLALVDVLTLGESADNPAENSGIENPPDFYKQGENHRFWHPAADYRHFRLTIDGPVEALLKPRMKDGELLGNQPSLQDIQQKVRAGLKEFDGSYKRFLNPHIYKVSMTTKLRDLKLSLIESYLGEL